MSRFFEKIAGIFFPERTLRLLRLQMLSQRISSVALEVSELNYYESDFSAWGSLHLRVVQLESSIRSIMKIDEEEKS